MYYSIFSSIIITPDNPHLHKIRGRDRKGIAMERENRPLGIEGKGINAGIETVNGD